MNVFFTVCMILLYVFPSNYNLLFFLMYFLHFGAVTRAPPSGLPAASQTEPEPCPQGQPP